MKFILKIIDDKNQDGIETELKIHHDFVETLATICAVFEQHPQLRQLFRTADAAMTAKASFYKKPKAQA